MSSHMFGLRRPALKSLVGPALTPEEMTGNLSVLEKNLNRHMKCPAGRNQVYIRSLIVLGGTTKPRIVLKCHLRKDIGQQGEVFYEHIRDVCCCDPEQCEAWRQLKERFVET
ncbi:hypothetical protein RAS1_31500 [Phycisphaerae bacterium RAS1]|nr:hypothetical protein RAS1_31500 [Phycisphaerae bacterium RAS1]